MVSSPGFVVAAMLIVAPESVHFTTGPLLYFPDQSPERRGDTTGLNAISRVALRGREVYLDESLLLVFNLGCEDGENEP
jgi:hypothetical protein